ncbi:MAG TPA: hydroxymethylglutaryl-CoA reductase [Thermoanaerobaculia bacterium]|nr:hydroxymethylglutaryl-CoA reductase [Thermoanaerobaculia bacterium]
MTQRRAWLEEVTGCALPMVGAGAIAGPDMRGNVENPIGAAQVPLGVAGPLVVRGEHADGTFYVPLATTEGAMVRSYERGMVAVTRAGGATARVLRDENRATPAFSFGSVDEAVAFARALPALEDELRLAAESTTRHGKLLRVEPRVAGHDVLVTFAFSTGDASGMNLVARATTAACALLVERFAPTGWSLLSGAEGEKQAGPGLYFGGKGKSVVAGVRLPAPLVRQVLGVEPAAMESFWRRCVVAQTQVGAVGINGHFANGLAAIFIACGQDVANVANSAVGVMKLEVANDGGLQASVHLPSLVVATVGGGTAVGTAPECLGLLGCVGAGKARRFAEIVIATLLAGEISFAAALVAGGHAEAHDRYGRKPAS